MPKKFQVFFMNTLKLQQASLHREAQKVKPVILMAITLFLISAPAPDSSDIAEMTSNFIVPESVPGLQAGQETTSKPVSNVSENHNLAATSGNTAGSLSKSQQAESEQQPDKG